LELLREHYTEGLDGSERGLQLVQGRNCFGCIMLDAVSIAPGGVLCELVHSFGNVRLERSPTSSHQDSRQLRERFSIVPVRMPGREEIKWNCRSACVTTIGIALARQWWALLFRHAAVQLRHYRRVGKHSRLL
jgi:hypothetical protein